ncbi:hypothetical protein QBC34DRAFT_380717 [Podospora aff. communis PSN243]|uniref:Uncharacterized protein n=1 Tax=Podospora aff. communis PSN243 TaxID=3040156 RepID=A0AAV9GKI3_9PEZI|nr:hypothetical protein QBC34DRAFT_380717 [Podospora aff. communis PSN243]
MATSKPTTTGTAAAATADAVVRLLTDNPNGRTTPGPLTAWDGHANPVPPGVDAKYWHNVYNRADSAVRHHVEGYVEEYCGGVSNKGKLDAVFKDEKAAEEVNQGTKWCREEGRTYKVAVLFLVRDLVATAEGDFRYSSGAQGVKEKKARSLRETRENLPQEFFTWFESTTTSDPKVGRQRISRFADVDDAELRTDSRWYGRGAWITTMDFLKKGGEGVEF